MKNNNYQTHYRTGARNVQLKIDEAFAERVIPANDSVRLLEQTVEEMDLILLINIITSIKSLFVV